MTIEAASVSLCRVQRRIEDRRQLAVRIDRSTPELDRLRAHLTALMTCTG